MTTIEVIQILSAVDCLLIMCYEVPNLGAMLVQKKSWKQKFIKVNNSLIKEDLAKDHILWGKLKKLCWIWDEPQLHHQLMEKWMMYSLEYEVWMCEIDSQFIQNYRMFQFDVK